MVAYIALDGLKVDCKAVSDSSGKKQHWGNCYKVQVNGNSDFIWL